MLKGLWSKFLVLLIAVALISLSSAFFLRNLMVRDFGEYLEGEMEDRVSWVTASLESLYEKHSGWHAHTLTDNIVWALMTGIEIRLYDDAGLLITDSEKALNALSPLSKKRLNVIMDRRIVDEGAAFIPYKLFLAGKEIGRLEVKFLQPHREILFITRSNKFLLISILALGSIAIILSFLFSRRMTRPINELTSAAASIEEGNLKSRVMIIPDDEIGRLSQAFNRMAQALDTQESLRKKLTSNIAHELRTPISAIRGELEGMLDGLIAPEKQNIQSLYDETGRLIKILEGIEELSRAEASTLDLNKQNLVLKPFIKNITDRFGKILRDKGISFELLCDDSLSVSADPDKLSQIIINLLSNAIKATGTNGRIWIKCHADKKQVQIETGDTGTGISPDDLPFIFERFYKSSGRGLGIGLTIVKELTEAHGGKILVQSRQGDGAVFTVSLPA